MNGERVKKEREGRVNGGKTGGEGRKGWREEEGGEGRREREGEQIRGIYEKGRKDEPPSPYTKSAKNVVPSATFAPAQPANRAIVIGAMRIVYATYTIRQKPRTRKLSVVCIEMDFG